jgi:hypothetical protein
MAAIHGIVRSLGPYEKGWSGWARYAYIEVGERVLKKIEVRYELTGPLTDVLREGRAVDLYLVKNVLYGVRRADGRTFASEVVPMLPSAILAVVLLGISLASLGVAFMFARKGALLASTVPLLVAFYPPWWFSKYLRAKFSALRLPGAIVI